MLKKFQWRHIIVSWGMCKPWEKLRLESFWALDTIPATHMLDSAWLFSNWTCLETRQCQGPSFNWHSRYSSNSCLIFAGNVSWHVRTLCLEPFLEAMWNAAWTTEPLLTLLRVWTSVCQTYYPSGNQAWQWETPHQWAFTWTIIIVMDNNFN